MICLVRSIQQLHTDMDTRRMHLAGPPGKNEVIRLGSPTDR